MKKLLIGLTLLGAMSSFASSGEDLPLPGSEVIHQMEEAFLRGNPGPNFFIGFNKLDITDAQAKRIYESGQIVSEGQTSFINRGVSSGNAIIDVYETFNLAETKSGVLCSKRVSNLEFKIEKVDENYRMNKLPLDLYEKKFNKHRCYVR